MRHLVTIFLMFLFFNKVAGQEKHFVFIQSDNKQPFYASVNGKIYSSSSTGYVIIPKLADGNYNVTVGFAKNAGPEQSFSVSIDKKDLGYNLKNFGEKGYGLFNLQTLDVTMAASASSSVSATAQNNIVDNDIISFPARKKDTSVARVDTKPTKKKAPAEPVVKSEDVSISTGAKDSTAVTRAGSGIEAPTSRQDTNMQQPTANAQTFETIATTKDSGAVKRDIASDATGAPKTETKQEDLTTSAVTPASTDVKKVSEKKSDEGVFLSFVDNNGKKTDTVQVIIPASKASAPSSSAPATTGSNISPSTTDSATIATQPVAAKKDEPKFLDVNVNSAKKETVDVASKQEEVTIMPNSNCKNIANDDDYARLRKKMAQETTDEKMIAEAKKYYRDKCFTTAQIKRLSTLFLSDEGRLNFFNASFLSVADSSQYPTLQSEFIDPAFVTRFKTLFQ